MGFCLFSPFFFHSFLLSSLELPKVTPFFLSPICVPGDAYPRLFCALVILRRQSVPFPLLFPPCVFLVRSSKQLKILFFLLRRNHPPLPRKPRDLGSYCKLNFSFASPGDKKPRR